MGNFDEQVWGDLRERGQRAYELLGGASEHWATVVDLAQGAQRLTDALLGQGTGPPIPGDTTVEDLLGEVERRLDELGA